MNFGERVEYTISALWQLQTIIPDVTKRYIVNIKGEKPIYIDYFNTNI